MSKVYTLNTGNFNTNFPNVISSSTQEVVSTYTNGVDNRVVTATGTSGINGESNLTFDGTVLQIKGIVTASGFSGSTNITLGTIQGGTGVSGVAGLSKRVRIGGSYDTTELTSNAVGMWIGDYNNDGTLFYPHYAEDENNNVDFFIKNRDFTTNSSSLAYFGGNVQLATSTASITKNVLDLGAGTNNRGISWGGATANYANIWTQHSNADLNMAVGITPSGSSTGSFHSSYGSAMGRALIKLGAFSPNAGTIIFYTSASGAAPIDDLLSLPERMRITAAGLVGIGNASPDTLLSLLHTGGSKMASSSTVPGSGATIRIKGTANNAAYYGIDTATPFGAWVQVADDRGLQTYYPFLLNPNGGNVGVGTYSPGTKLHVQGDISASSYTSSITGIDAVGFRGTASFAVTSSFAVSASRASSSLAVDVLSGGSVTGLGQYSGSFTGSLAGTFNGTSSWASNSISSSYSTTASYAINAGGGAGFPFSGSAVITGSLLISSSTLNGTALYITGALRVSGSITQTTGSLQISSGAIGVGMTPSSTIGRIDATNDVVSFSSSDMRLKKNIQIIQSALPKIIQLNGIEFEWIDDPDIKIYHGYTGKDIGIIAQEVEALFPSIVQTRDSGYKAVRYERFIPILVEAIKELKREIDLLKQRKE